MTVALTDVLVDVGTYAASASGATAITSNIPSTVLSGDIIVTQLSYGSTSAAGYNHTTPSGWTQYAQTRQSSSSAYDVMFYKVAVGGETSVVLNRTDITGSMYARSFILRGIEVIAGVVTFGPTTNGSGTTAAAPSLTWTSTVPAGYIALALFGQASNHVDSAWTGGFTRIGGVSSGNIKPGAKLINADEAPIAGYTLDTNSYYSVIGASLKLSSATPVTPTATTASVASFTGTGWTNVGGAVSSVAALNDSSETTYIETNDASPAAVPGDIVFTPVAPVANGGTFLVDLREALSTVGASGTMVVSLRNAGADVGSPVTLSVTGSATDGFASFTGTAMDALPDSYWTSGPQVHVIVTAA